MIVDMKSVLQSLPVAELTYDEWLRVGMALRNEGYPLEVWEEWSKGDSRYHAGECEKKWASFEGYSGPKVKGGTIVQIARDHGFRLPDGNDPLEWEEKIAYEGGAVTPREVQSNGSGDNVIPRNNMLRRARNVLREIDRLAEQFGWKG